MEFGKENSWFIGLLWCVVCHSGNHPAICQESNSNSRRLPPDWFDWLHKRHLKTKSTLMVSNADTVAVWILDFILEPWDEGKMPVNKNFSGTVTGQAVNIGCFQAVAFMRIYAKTYCSWLGLDDKIQKARA